MLSVKYDAMLVIVTHDGEYWNPHFPPAISIGIILWFSLAGWSRRPAYPSFSIQSKTFRICGILCISCCSDRLWILLRLGQINCDVNLTIWGIYFSTSCPFSHGICGYNCCPDLICRNILSQLPEILHIFPQMSSVPEPVLVPDNS